MLFYRILKNQRFPSKKNVNNKRKRKLKRQKTRTKVKGKTVLFKLEDVTYLRKRCRLLGRGGNRQNIKFELFRKKYIMNKNLKLLKIITYITNFTRFNTEFEWLSYRIYRSRKKLDIQITKIAYWSLKKMSTNILNMKEISVKCIRRITMEILLIIGNVEINPGPNQTQNNHKLKTNKMEIMTYNCNGLGTLVKRRRILNKASGIVNRGGIVMLQETHLTNNEQVISDYKEKFELSNHKSNSAGVITLFSNNFEVLYKDKDEIGRELYTLVQNKEEKFLLVNIYCPNDHKTSINFIEGVYIKIIRILNDFPDCFVFLARDFNCCMTSYDYLNRNKSVAENELTLLLKQNNEMCELVDSYRIKNTEPGYTWNRGNCYSRLDYIYVSGTLLARIHSTKSNWSYDKSDHAALVTTIIMRDEIRKGPGITKVNTDILKNSNKLAQIRSEVINLINQIPTDWNGHLKLEYMKMVLRSTIAQYTGQKRKEDKLETEEMELELNDIENIKIKIINKKNSFLPNEYDTKLNNIEIAKTTLTNKLKILRNEISKQYELKLKAKWYEFGEKSNKFFLNLQNFKNKQKLIEEINDEGSKYIGQEQITIGKKKFYQKLYSKQTTTNQQDDTFFKHCPKLDNSYSNYMDKEITMEEMHKALLTCQDTSPGPDGIPYSVYKIFWPQVGPIIKESWEYSVKTGQTPISHKESVITMLPKEGKDTKDIKNWRPITLTNCDAKIITKSLAIRMNQIIDKIIDPSQTAYVPGRSVMDNLRGNRFLKNYCKTNNIEAVLTSLDAKKAFDSVDHKYIELVLSKYGFGNNFVNYFKTIYRDLTAKILVNGHFTESFKVERGVKQGDALSCAIFIICIDPLIRNLNNNKNIKHVNIKQNHNKLNIIYKASGFADDVSIICMNDELSVREIFVEYQRLTNLSGLTLNADKTEILNLNPNSAKVQYKVQYNNQDIQIKTVLTLKICGISFCKSEEEEYTINVLDKIDKLKSKLKLWQNRHLTLEGKSLIVKTFGISQLVYIMQCVNIRKEDLKRTEQFIFNFLWGTKNINNARARDRIKRSIMKNDYNEGGLKITDIECLDKSLKLRQYIRADNSVPSH